MIRVSREYWQIAWKESLTEDMARDRERAELGSLVGAEHPLARISVDPAKRSGQACIRDLRITVRDILEYLAGGMTEAGRAMNG